MLQLPDIFWPGFFGSVVYGVLALFFLIGGFKAFDKLLPKIDFEEILNQNPLATAIVIGAFFIALAIIIAAVVI